MITRKSLLALAATALAVLAACDRHHASPTAPDVSGAAVKVTSLQISGNQQLSQLGETSQLTAQVRFSDGASQDVTQAAQWQVSLDPAVSMRSPGLVVAERWGLSLVSASYGQPALSSEVPVRVAPAGTYLLRGSVSRPSGTPLAGAQIKVKSSAGTYSMETDASGVYALPARGTTTLRLEARGYEEITREFTIDSDSMFDIVAHPKGGGDLNGVYRVTVQAAVPCDLPPITWTRDFEAIVSQVGAEIFVEAQGYQFVAWGGAGFTGTRNESSVAFVISDSFADDYVLVERIDGLGDLYFSGTATGTIRDRDVDAIFDGTFQLNDQKCTSSSHKLTLDWVKQ